MSYKFTIHAEEKIEKPIEVRDGYFFREIRRTSPLFYKYKSVPTSFSLISLLRNSIFKTQPTNLHHFSLALVPVLRVKILLSLILMIVSCNKIQNTFFLFSKKAPWNKVIFISMNFQISLLSFLHFSPFSLPSRDFFFFLRKDLNDLWRLWNWLPLLT